MYESVANGNVASEIDANESVANGNVANDTGFHPQGWAMSAGLSPKSWARN